MTPSTLSRMQRACTQVPDHYRTYIEACADEADMMVSEARIPDSYYAIIEAFDALLDDRAHQDYRTQPLAQDWARVCKVAEELGEAIAELIAFTGQNPRKGVHGGLPKLLDELSDVAGTAILAIQHFTKDRDDTRHIVESKMAYNYSRVSR